MFCTPLTLRLLYCITETIPVAEGRNFFLEVRMLASPALDRFMYYRSAASLNTEYAIMAH